MRLKIYFLSFLLLGLYACNSQKEPVSLGQNPEWLIPIDEIYDGGPGKDGIPALLNPHSVQATEIGYLQDEDLVLGYKVGEEAHAYPHPILDWHEIINDAVGSEAISIIYCPLTGTGIGWDREINGATTSFGVSGLLYNSNIIPYDRLTDSNWSQIQNKCVNGQIHNIYIYNGKIFKRFINKCYCYWTSRKRKNNLSEYSKSRRPHLCKW